MLIETSFASALPIEDDPPTMGAGAAVRAAEAQPERREAAAEEPILSRRNKQTRARQRAHSRGKIGGAAGLESRSGARHTEPCRDEPHPFADKR